VITRHAGELIQHDSSYHRWSPYIAEKFYLITSLDDYSRYLFYADVIERETSWAHITALESVCTRYGLPLSYYVDNHSMFRFLEKRDTMWTKHHARTDEKDPQWKQVLQELRVKVTYALSPQAKGKIERPYRWLQDRIARTCARENVQTISRVREILCHEVKRYNEHQVHSTTGEIPRIRLERAIAEGRTLFRPFKLPFPFQSTKDIFCLRGSRIMNAYRKISVNDIEFRVPGVDPYEKVDLRMVPDPETGLTEIRFWHNGKLVSTQKIKTVSLRGVRF
jgi:hypothetical protein